VALDGTVEIRGAERKVERLVYDLYTGPGETCLETGDVLTSIRVPASAMRRELGFEKLRLWEGDFALVSAAVSAAVVNGRWSDVRICVGGISPTPWRPVAAERSLQDQPATVESLESEVAAVLAAEAHPLPGTAWKLRVAAALAGRAALRAVGEGYYGPDIR